MNTALEPVPSVLAAKTATATIPIVFVMAGDPVRAGIVASLGRPGANVTGVSTLNTEVGQKRLELLRELMPAATVVAALINPNNPTAAIQSRDMQDASDKLGMKLHILHAKAVQDFEAVFARLKPLQANALVVNPDAFFISQIGRWPSLRAFTGCRPFFSFVNSQWPVV